MLHKEAYSAFRQLCMEHGFKCTQQRFAVYQVMKGNRSHPNVDQIWHQVQREIPSITRESVFR
ncbi:MAG: transcriptional repressor, partial [Lentisphaeria bacterium]|nr:transcriptional repressor [Lentisphaeria bacterium]